MTPILGIVLADGANLRRRVLLVVAGAAAVVVIGWLLGLFVPYSEVAATNSQVAARAPPHRGPGGRPGDRGGRFGGPGPVRYLRHIARRGHRHLAGATAAVVGLTLTSGAPRQALGAFLLFVTNVAAILASGIVVMAFHRVHWVFGAASSRRPGTHRGHRAEPRPSLTLLRRDLNAAGLDGLDVRVNLVPAGYQPVPK